MRAWLVIVVVAGCDRGNADAPAATATPVERDVEPARLVVDTDVAVVGAQTTARVRVVPHAPFHINDHYKFKLALEPTPGIDLAKTTFRPADAEAFDADQLVVPVAVVPTSTGDFTIRGNVDVGVCSPRSCVTQHLPVSIVIAAR
jgi:hypothetical protein